MIPTTRAEMEKFFRDALDWDGYYRPHSETMVDDIVSDVNTLTRERDEARAEVERLRLPAEAWEAQEAWRFCDGRNQALRAQLYTRRNDTAARARAAKGQA